MIAVARWRLMVRACLGVVAATIPPAGSVAVAQGKVTAGAFIDAYYAFDFNRPSAKDRAFTTQPARHNEFNVNLAYVEARLDGPQVRGRLALQAGTSVQVNYAAEPALGTASGPSLTRHIQEAYAGMKLAPALWLDGGIFYSQVGSEGWVSREQPTYSRSLAADFSPYYQAGVRLTWTPTAKLTAQLDLVNGWQIVSENNDGKTVGMRLDDALSPKLTVSYYNLIGNEQPQGTPSRLRVFQGAEARYTPASRWLLVAQMDVGFQRRAVGGGQDLWYGGSLIAHRNVSAAVALVGRVERYQDNAQVIVQTGTPRGFRANGASFGVDVTPSPGLLWRSEVRGLSSRDPVFPSSRATGSVSDGDVVVVTSLAVSF